MNGVPRTIDVMLICENLMYSKRVHFNRGAIASAESVHPFMFIVCMPGDEVAMSFSVLSVTPSQHCIVNDCRRGRRHCIGVLSLPAHNLKLTCKMFGQERKRAVVVFDCTFHAIKHSNSSRCGHVAAMS